MGDPESQEDADCTARTSPAPARAVMGKEEDFSMRTRLYPDIRFSV